MGLPATDAPTCVELPVDDVCAAARFFRQVLAVPVHQHDANRADVDLAPDLVAHLRTAPARPLTVPRDRPGPVISLEVPDLRGAVEELRRRGATVLVEPVLTDWGTRSAFLSGPEDVLLEVYRPA